jgi:hypothetical protein
MQGKWWHTSVIQIDGSSAQVQSRRIRTPPKHYERILRSGDGGRRNPT